VTIDSSSSLVPSMEGRLNARPAPIRRGTGAETRAKGITGTLGRGRTLLWLRPETIAWARKTGRIE